MEEKSELDRERYERVKARVGVSNLPSDQRFKQRNAVAASLSTYRKSPKPVSCKPSLFWTLGRRRANA